MGGLGEAMALGLSHELREDPQSWKGRASLGRGPWSHGKGISTRVHARKSLSGKQEEIGLEREPGPRQGAPGRLRLKCSAEEGNLKEKSSAPAPREEPPRSCRFSLCLKN